MLWFLVVIPDRGEIWRHFATFDYPVKSVYFTTRTACFVENWRGTGEDTRSAHYKMASNTLYTCTNKWFYFQNTTFNVNQSVTMYSCYNENYDCVVQDNHCYCIRTGGKDTKPNEGVDPRCNVSLVDVGENTSPDLPPPEFEA